MKINLAVIILLCWAASAPAITIETVQVGDAGNANDPSDGDGFAAGVQNYGAVGYEFNIGKYEVTVDQYAAFLNAVAAIDSDGLYNPSMASDARIAGIARNGSAGNYSYSVIGSANHPVTYVSWIDAARFVNWLQNGQPTGPLSSTTTEDGAYNLAGATNIPELLSVPRNLGATWFLPSENEWYKAAYYQPSTQGGDSDGYWTYALRTNSIPYSDQPPGATPDNTRVANIYFDDFEPNGYNDGYAATGSGAPTLSENYLTDVGAYTSSPSFYGTFDQGGNVAEWNDTIVGDSGRGARGSSWTRPVPFNAVNYGQASWRSSQNPFAESNTLGFRVARTAVPEPSTILLAIAALVVLPSRRSKPTYCCCD